MGKSIEINIIPAVKIVREKVMNKLSWRDSWYDNMGELQEIYYEGEGGELGFFFNGKRMVPHTVDVYKNKELSCMSDVKNYIDSLNIEYETLNDLSERGLTIAIDQENNSEKIENIAFDIENKIRQNKWGACFINEKN